VARRKVQVPEPGPAVVPRPHLDARLEEVGRRRLTLVTAGPGLGKTTLLAGFARRTGCAWYTVDSNDRDPTVLARGVLEALRDRIPSLDPATVVAPPAGQDLAIASEGQESVVADQLIRMLSDGVDGDVTLVLDDAHELAGSDLAGRLLGELVLGAPPQLHLVLSSRLDPPFGVTRLRAQGLAVDLPGSTLRFMADETATMAVTVLGPAGAEVADALHAQTAGWPTAVRIVTEWLRQAPASRWPAMIAEAGAPGTPLEGYVGEEILPTMTRPEAELLRAVAGLERFTAPLAAELVGPGAEEQVSQLVRDGLWIVPDDERHGWYVVPPVLCQVVATQPDHIVARRAAAWMEGQGETGPAFTALLGDAPAGHDNAACAEAGARLIRGDYDEALALVGPSMPPDGPIPMSAGLVAGLVHHLRGELDEALAIYERSLAGAGDPPLRALVLGWAASAAWLVGDVDRSRAFTEELGRTAGACGDDRALAMAFTAKGMIAAIDGDRRAMHHYERALTHAEGAHDHVQIVRIRTNRGSRYLSEGYFREALGELDEAVRLADLAGIALFGALASSNRGEALMGLGRLDEARREFEAARAGYERIGSRMASYPLTHLGTVHRLQGHVTLARAHFEEAMSIGEASGDHQGLVPALAGLAMVLAESDPEEALRLAGRAGSLASLARPKALIAATEAAVRTGDLTLAASRAEEAGAAARDHRDRPALAEALELRAKVTADPVAAGRILDEAATIWLETGSPLGRARVLLARARLGGPDAGPLAAKAEQALRLLGAHGLVAEAAALQADLASAARPALAVRVLGGFSVERTGTTVLATEWQSRKARDLLKMLIARRGHPVARDVLLDRLWPDEDPSKSGSRLSVTLSTLRAVLDPDKAFDAEQFIANDRGAAWIRLENVSVDVEAFLADATAGLRALSAGDAVAASHLLTSAEVRYAGEFLEEDPYEDAFVVLREEARTTYVSVAMALADLALAAGDHDGAVRYLLRVLARDPYDERAHLLLITALSAAGRHGESRRMYRAYCGRMAEIAVEPAAFPDAGARRPAGLPA
jgi:ATP/maltotriose-dependent transcriptional regulator MalT/DNA-binding SARP family transcriptional activator